VVVNVASNDATEGTVEPATLTFDPTLWDSAKSVTVTGVDDEEVDGNVAYAVTFEVTSSDGDFDGLAVPAVAVTNLDDEFAPGVTSIAPSSGHAAGGQAFTIVGTDFRGAVTVSLGAQGVSNPVRESDTTITGTSPALAAGGLYNVVVTNGDGTTGSLQRGYMTWFSDMPGSDPVSAFVEKLLRAGITGGCGGGNYCGNNAVTRAQMAVFLLRAKYGTTYAPPPATGAVFGDVQAETPAAAWIEQLYNEGIAGGCGGGNYCPNSPVTRGQMAVFLLVTKEGTSYQPAPATGVFNDVPQGDPFAKWIEELARRGITAGCGAGNYCPANVVTRRQMAVFLVTTMGL
jgi:hypothetical protein